jgi:hypothetical protein
MSCSRLSLTCVLFALAGTSSIVLGRRTPCLSREVRR